MAYRAEIEIGVKGTEKLRNLRSTLDEINKRVTKLDELAETFQSPIQSIASFNRALQTASETLRTVELAQKDETTAIRNYVTALGQANEAAARQNRLIEAEVTLRNKAKKSIETRQKRDEFLAGPGRTIAAEKSAQRAAKESARRQREFKEIENYNRSIFKIEQGFNNQIRGYEIDTLLKTFKLEENLQDRAFRNALDLDRKEGAAFDAELRRRVQATQAADRAASEARRLTGQSSPIGGAVNIPGSPAAKRRTANRQALTRGAGIGLATANIPGSNIAQAAAIGAGFGGPKGAAIAASVAAVSQAISGLVRLGPEVAKTEAQLSKLSIALRGILGSKSAEGFRAIDKAARDFNQPILDATKNFTQLSAAATANGNSVKQTETLYRALSAATKATGGDAQDLSGVLRAATQVISKGVVRSEELRGQIGDRLPGAFQLFAQATNRSAEELQKALEQGEVSADEFVTTFANFILNKYEPAALRIGDSPAEAGARLTKALEDANRAAGPLLLALGAKFQDFATEALKALTPLLEGLDQAFNLDKRTARGYARDLKELADLDEKITTQEDFQEKAIGVQAEATIEREIARLEQRRSSVIRDINDYLANVKSPKALTPLKPTTETPDVPKGRAKADKSAERAAREEERLQERLAALRIEINLIAANADFKQKITAAEIAGNKELAIKLKAQQTSNTIQANEEKALIRIDDIREKNLERQKTAAKINAANVAAAAELAVFEDQKQKAFDEQIESLNFQYEILTATTVEKQKQLEIEQQMAALKGKDFTPEQLEKIKAAKEKLDIGPIQTYINELQRSLSDTESMVVSLAQSVESSLATAMSSAVQTLITGTGSVKEAFSTMFADIGKAFIDMATQMIAKALIMKALGILSSAFGGGGGGGGIGFNPSAPSITGNSIGDFGGGTPFFAEGGYVTGPTSAVVGEGGEPEYIIPESKMRESMGRYSRGSRGNSVIPANGGGGDASGGGTATLAPIDVRYTVERINSVDYVTADQFQAGMREAASSGARQGEQRALSTLRQNTTQRRRIGI